MLHKHGDTPVESALAVLERLVSFPTVSSDTNLPLIDYVEEMLRKTGARLHRVPDESGAKANLIVSVGPREAGGTVLSGHSDVVPVDGQSWASDPFALAREGDTVAGRGTADMKGFLAACIAALERVTAEDLARPIHLCVSYDEEVGCLGAPSLVSALLEREPMPRFAIIGEPTMMEIVTAHKSCVVSETVFGGHSAHSSQSHLGVSATLAAARFVGELERRFAVLRDEAEGAAATKAPGANLSPPHATFNAGVISGGTALNIIPRDAGLVWEYRTMPHEDPEGVAREMDAFVRDELIPFYSRAEHPLTVETTRKALVQPLDPGGNRAAREALMALGPYEGDGAVAFGTEAGIFQAAGIPSVVCGPGTIEVAHKPDEALAVSQLAAASALVDRVIAAAKA